MLPLIRIGLWIVFLVSAMLLPFLPGEHDPLAATISMSASGASFVGLLFVPIGAAWLLSGRGYACARVALMVSVLVAGSAAIAAWTQGSMAASIAMLAASGVWLLSLWRRIAPACNLYFEHPSSDFAAREIVMYNPHGEQDFSSHVVDLLQLSPEAIRQQRGYFRSDPLEQNNWKRFLFD